MHHQPRCLQGELRIGEQGSHLYLAAGLQHLLDVLEPKRAERQGVVAAVV